MRGHNVNGSEIAGKTPVATQGPFMTTSRPICNHLPAGPPAPPAFVFFTFFWVQSNSNFNSNSRLLQLWSVCKQYLSVCTRAPRGQPQLLKIDQADSFSRVQPGCSGTVSIASIVLALVSVLSTRYSSQHLGTGSPGLSPGQLRYTHYARAIPKATATAKSAF